MDPRHFQYRRRLPRELPFPGPPLHELFDRLEIRDEGRRSGYGQFHAPSSLGSPEFDRDGRDEVYVQHAYGSGPMRTAREEYLFQQALPPPPLGSHGPLFGEAPNFRQSPPRFSPEPQGPLFGEGPIFRHFESLRDTNFRSFVHAPGNQRTASFAGLNERTWVQPGPPPHGLGPGMTPWANTRFDPFGNGVNENNISVRDHRFFTSPHRQYPGNTDANRVLFFGSTPGQQGRRSSLENAPRSHGLPAPPFQAGPRDMSFDETIAWTYQMQDLIRSTVEGRDEPRAHPGVQQPNREPRTFASGRLVPDNIEFAVSYDLQDGHSSNVLEGAIRSIHPSGAPPENVILLIYEPDEMNHIRYNQYTNDGIIHADDWLLMRNDGAMWLFSNYAYRTGTFPRILRERQSLNVAPDDDDNDRPAPASQGTMASLRTRQIVPGDLDESGKANCGICLEERQVGQNVTVLPCNHYFDRDCIERWLGQNGSCPTCRRVVET